ncbi:alcohol dehydrogenase [candidate division WOR_3 bacterium SM23_60]|uniref:Alcohol dehydrogenase n=1 Tax=candidate division WOR_3 bacterium SM23_60 TaxID=1703780 RepID=A0A0S8GHF4_UNCW3|nr:MAG: alcohol dehydrogenase [candidate division WOR_3 bacterium SM23_60]
MKAAVYYNNKDIRIKEMPKPEIGKREILVKVMASGICGSDVMEWYRIKKAPRVLGHEIAGEIVEVGAEVDRYQVGQRVFVSHHVPCNECRYCKAGYHTVCATLRSTNFDPGGFAEFVRVPEINLRNGIFSLPEDVTFEEGTFVEPLGCVIRGQRFAGVKPGHALLVIGSGISGLMHIQLARLSGAAKIIATDISEYRLEAARRFGADVAIHAREDVAKRVRNVNQGRLADVVIVCTAALPAFVQAFESVDCAGTVLLFAPTAPDVSVPLPLYDIYFKSAKIIFSYAAVTDDILEAIELLKSKRFNAKAMITHRYGLTDIKQGFDLVAQAEDSIKVIIFPDK